MIKFIAVIIIMALFMFGAKMCNEGMKEQDRIGYYSKIVTTADGTQYKVRTVSSAQGYPLVTLFLADGTQKQISPAQIKDISDVGYHTGK